MNYSRNQQISLKDFSFIHIEYIICQGSPYLRTCPQVSGYFCIPNLFVGNRPFVHTYPTISSSLFGNFCICSPEWKFLYPQAICRDTYGLSNPEIFLPDYATTSESILLFYFAAQGKTEQILPRFRSVKYKHKIGICACSAYDISKGVLETRMNPDTFRLRMDAKFF